MTKYIFVTGGVLSSLGKGVTAASLGRLLKSRGYSIFVLKLDPYLNIDPGTMSPYEHGEVFVTKDGAETDLDLGHYERFIDSEFTNESNYTSGRIYSEIFKRERQGKYEGRTIQVIPHITDYIEDIILNAGKKSNPDFVIIEVGGTVGDIELQPFIHAFASFARKKANRSFFIHIAYAPFLESSKEFKSKPIQHSLRELRQYGLEPNTIIIRSDLAIDSNISKKIAISTIFNDEAIINLPNFSNIYEIPLYLEEKGLAKLVENYFGLNKKRPNLSQWKKFTNMFSLQEQKKEIVIAMIGKYIELEDAYMSIIEALKISAIYANAKLKLKWIKSSNIDSKNVIHKLSNIDGAMILPGFGIRGFEGKIIASSYLHNKKIPTFGICYGMQAMTIAQARQAGIKDAISVEHSQNGEPIIDLIKDKNNKLIDKMNLGHNEIEILKNSIVYKIYKSSKINERHRHRYAINKKYIKDLEKNGFKISGFSTKYNIPEIIEDSNHPFYIGVQFHPEFQSNPLNEHKLFASFIKSCLSK